MLSVFIYVWFVSKVTKSVISLLNYYGWKKFSIIHEELWTTVADSLKVQAKNKNMTINHCEKVIDNHKCCENDMKCCRSGYWYQVRKQFVKIKYIQNVKIIFEKKKVLTKNLFFHCSYLSWSKRQRTVLEFMYFLVPHLH